MDIVYLGIGILSFLTMLPLAPFAHKLHLGLLWLSALVIVLTTLFNLFAFPFSNEAPLKVYFKQTIDLNEGVNTVTLTGVEPFLSKYLIPEFPSTANVKVTCSKGSRFPELTGCSWKGLQPEVASGSPPKMDQSGIIACQTGLRPNSFGRARNTLLQYLFRYPP